MAKMMLIGGTGGISEFTVQDLLAQGHEVALLMRGLSETQVPEGVRAYHGDRNDAALVTEAISDFRPDVLMDFVCYTREQMAAVLEAAYGRVGHFVFVSTVDAYGYPLTELPMPESGTRNEARGSYAAEKQVCEQMAWARHDEAVFPVTVVRPTYSIHRRFVISLFSLSSAAWIASMRRGLPVVVPGEGSTLIHASDARDTGRMIARIAGERIAYGKTYCCGTDGAVITHVDYVRMVARAAGCEADIRFIPREKLLAAPQKAIRESLYPGLIQYDLSFAMDGFKQDFPDFRWYGEVEEVVSEFVGRLDRSTSIEPPAGSEIEEALLELLHSH